MSHMKRLKTAIDEYCEEDHELNDIITFEINQHLHDEITFDMLSSAAQYIMYGWEEEEEEISLTRYRNNL